MKTILLITLLESFVITLLLVLWRFKGAYMKTPARIISPSIVSGLDNLPAKFLGSAAVDSSRWSFINSWKVAAQGDDRTPMHGDVARSPVSASVGRSVARRRHQAMYKQWSQERHD